METEDGRSLLEDAIAAVILSDYAKGTLPERVCQALIAAARGRGIPVLVDPKGSPFHKYARATTLTPNLHELEVAVGHGPLAEPALRGAGHHLRNESDSTSWSSPGATRASPSSTSGAADFPAVAREVFDVSGAGDTIIATLTAGLVAGLDRDDALRLANLAAAIVVGKVGTAPIRRDELPAHWRPIISPRRRTRSALATLLERVADCAPG